MEGCVHTFSEFDLSSRCLVLHMMTWSFIQLVWFLPVATWFAWPTVWKLPSICEIVLIFLGGGESVILGLRALLCLFFRPLLIPSLRFVRDLELSLGFFPWFFFLLGAVAVLFSLLRPYDLGTHFQAYPDALLVYFASHRRTCFFLMWRTFCFHFVYMLWVELIIQYMRRGFKRDDKIVHKHR